MSNDSYMQAYASAEALDIDFKKSVHAGLAPTTNGSPASLVMVITAPFAYAMNICPKLATFLTSVALVTQGENLRFSTSGMAALAYSEISKAQASIPPNQMTSTYSPVKAKVNMAKTIARLTAELTPKLTSTSATGKAHHAKVLAEFNKAIALGG